MSTLLIDSGESYYIKGNRISEEFEGKEVFISFMALLSKWALRNGATNIVATNTNHIRSNAEANILDMVKNYVKSSNVYLRVYK